MAISGGVVWQVQADGADTNGGGFRGGAYVATPSAPTVSATVGGGVAVATYYVVVTITDGNGETSKSAETAITTDVSNKTIHVTSPTDPLSNGATWNIYVGTVSGGPYFSNNTGLTPGTAQNIIATPATTGTQAPGTDRSKQAGAQVVVNNSTITCTTPGANSNTLTFTGGYVPTAADVGNIFNATAGTNINLGRYEVTAWTSTTWTVSGAANLTTAGGAGAAITGNMGGAYATPGMIGSAETSGNGAFVNYNASAYSCSSSANVTGGRINSAQCRFIVGYDTTRDMGNTDANRPTLNAGSNTMTVVTSSRAATLIANLIAAANAHTSVTGLSHTGQGSTFFRCDGTGAMTTGLTSSSSNGVQFILCKADGPATGFGPTQVAYLLACVAKNCTSFGFKPTNYAVLVNCVAYSNTGSGVIGFSLAAGNVWCVDCVAYSNGGDGFFVGASGPYGNLFNCISYGNGGGGGGGYNYNFPTTNQTGQKLVNCAGGSGTTGNYPNTSALYQGQILNFVVLTADPFTNGAGGDLSLNGTLGGGAACKAAAIPGSTAATKLPGLSTSSYPDIGASQSQATAGAAIFLM